MTCTSPAPQPTSIRRRARTRVTALAVIVAMATVLVPATSFAADRPDLAGRFVDSVNAERVAKGLPRLRMATDLGTVASRHSVRMANQTHLHHNPDLTTDVRNWQRVAENVGRGRSVSTLHQAFMKSEGHRRNILDDKVTEIGVGVEVRDGTVWVTKVFRRPSNGGAAHQPFRDVGRSSAHANAISRLVGAGVTAGCTGDRFCPGDQVTRGQIATFIGRAKGVLPNDSGPFVDVASTATHAGNIFGTSAARITSGCERDRFCADEALTRRDMAEYLGRALGLTPKPLRSFADVDPADPVAGWIQALADVGVTTGCRTDAYCADEPVSRGQMASFLVRAFKL